MNGTNGICVKLFIDNNNPSMTSFFSTHGLRRFNKDSFISFILYFDDNILRIIKISNLSPGTEKYFTALNSEPFTTDSHVLTVSRSNVLISFVTS